MLKDILKVDRKKFAEILVIASKVKEGEQVYDFISWKTELSNEEYRIFLRDLLIQKREDEFLMADVRDEAWMTSFDSAYNQPLVNTYFSHPAYDNYPVVNIKREGAELFCKWLTEEIGKSDKNKENLREVRLPTNREWEYLASGGGKNQPYPWGGPYVRNSEGCFLANYYPMKGNYSADGALYTCAVNSYAPNSFGIFNAAGNAAEMVTYPYGGKQIGARGGSWIDVSKDMKIYAEDKYMGISMPKPFIGFRPVITYSVSKQNGIVVDRLNKPKPKLTPEEIEENGKRKVAMIKEMLKNKNNLSDFIYGSMNWKGEEYNISPFSLKETEVSNIEYRTFLLDLIVQEKYEEFEVAKPNSILWCCYLRKLSACYILVVLKKDKFGQS